ncbi:helix-turn-helix domain-containing protein [Ponticoccus sp. SC2-23]|uniref:helix-turn-helix domain-containing protein n=1 Tax=Alexandriicola marinus TaxID=2081710 RepID=UPI000FDAD8E4|nr:helix-turn-helix transcriptional regulator [Alexandriicola marinus]MBM1219533.1 helix-turn-helix domain-containing protein [Ponticoccus sp. SC6-9]MBM1223395.1 helix-turn-helix domain-containing protein [Ponticoccus sp. SC6-15]MBM1229346.1 helix-turn-helix domain-containing protein [Ponticoccus sp. SC6-38]MBM1232361.1 helix-turn-helix domain-containing protein [Ponticoccus sp. SC6-45]MBM1237689.1 helix-turn-helix domain-containing protein [Ponticoccus sp. SC6-49]MBM1241372.1 helix-turn-heli
MPKQLTGTRIRDRRLARGMRQADLAREAGISASYLNLIEHNRRRIGGKVLNDIARLLDVDPSMLAEGAAETLVADLETAARSARAEIDTAEPAVDFASRFPGWAALVTAQAARIDTLEDRIAALSDRIAHDPQLETALHEVLSVVTSIRSTSSILVGSDGLDRDWETRFYKNIFDDSLRLAESSQALAVYLEAPEGGGAAGLGPAEEFIAWLDERGHHIPELELPDADVRAYMDRTDWPSEAVTAVARPWLERYRDDARALPLDHFAEAAARHHCHPGALAEDTGAPLARIMRRLAALPEAATTGLPAIGIAICDGAGALIYQKPLPGFELPQTAPGCPLLPLYGALSQPARPLRAVISLPGGSAPRLSAYAVAEPRAAASFDAPPVMEATMLVLADAPAATAQPVGRTCRICPRPRCAARREPALVPMTGS